MKCTLFFLVLTVAVIAKNCGKGIAGCSKYGTKYCCSYWGYCGTTSAYCGSGSTQCACDCNGKNPCMSSSSTSTSSKSCTNYKTTAALNIRAGPGTNNKIVKTVSLGTTLCVVSISNGWAKLNSGNYCSAKYITKPNSSSSSSSSNNLVNGSSVAWRGTKEPAIAVKEAYKGTCRGPNTIVNKQQIFINKIVLACQKQEWKHHILASTIIAQAILESGWGKNPICNNLFGVKSTSASEPRCLTNTGEYYNGQYTKIDAYFRSYNSWEDSIADHSNVLLKSRYADAIAQRSYKKTVKAIAAGGYATAPNYASSLISVIETYGLWQYDLCCDYVSNPSCLPDTTKQKYYYAAPDGKCGLGHGSCAQHGSSYCCSRWGYCGQGTAFCGSGASQCQCDCSGTKPCCSSNSTSKC